jgi:hypothetical protein
MERFMEIENGLVDVLFKSQSSISNIIVFCFFLLGIAGTLIRFVLKRRKQKILIQDKEKKIVLEGYTSSEVVDIIDRVRHMDRTLPPKE